MEMRDILLLNLAFVAAAGAVLVWAQWRMRPGPMFPGPPPVGTLFKIWLVVIWLVGLALPIAALVAEGGAAATRLALLPYLATFVLQVATELFVWKRWRSPVWVLVPCLFLPWRVFQAWLGLGLVAGQALPVTEATLVALMILWVINVGVHYSNIVNTLRWHAHPHDATFASLRDPRVFVAGANGGPAE